MGSLGLNSRLKADKFQYALQLDSGQVSESRQLRGMRKDPVFGYCWSRKEEFIAKHKYGVDIGHVAAVLAGLMDYSEYGFIKLGDVCPGIARYQVTLRGVGPVYASVYEDGKVKKILKVVSLKSG